MSNPDLPGSYWQDQDDAGYGSGWHTGQGGPQRADSPWDDDGAGFWRDDRGRRDDRGVSRDSRQSRGQDIPSTDRPRLPRGGGRAVAAGAAAGDASWPGMLAGRSRRAAQARDTWGNDGAADRNGRFSQTAEDLRNRLGLRGSAAGRGRARANGAGANGTGPNGAGSNGAGSNGAGSNGAGLRRAPTGRHDIRGAQPDASFWDQPAGQRDATASGTRAGVARPDASRSGGSGVSRTGDLRARAGRDRAGSARGIRRAASGDADYGDYGHDYGDGRVGSRTALRDQPGEFGTGDRAGRGSRSRLAERPGIRGGGGAGGGGGRGRGGGGRWEGSDPRSRGERFKEWLLHGTWWRRWTWKKAFGVLGFGAAAFVLLGVAAFFIIYEQTPIPTASELAARGQSSTVYFSNGKQLGTFDDTVNGVNIDRQILTSNQIPLVMTQAMTAAEDRHFYTEGGVSIPGLLRSAYQDLFGSGNLQGGSTITMQYAKNYYSDVNTGRNLSTKIKEIFVAMKLGHQKSKPWVMTSYLNTVPFGPTTYGLGASAESYFNINLTKKGATLSISQAAMLAAMPNSPGVFNPNPSAGLGYQLLKARWASVLANMVRDGNITQQVANEQTFPKLTPPPAGNGYTGYTGYLMSMVEQQLEAPKALGGLGLTHHQLVTGGFRITTTFSLAKVNELARSVNAAKAAMRAAGLPFHLYDRIGAVLENSKNGAIVAVYGGPGYGSRHCVATTCNFNTAEAAEPVGSSFKPIVLATAVNENMNVFTSKLNGFSPIWIPESPADKTLTELTLSPTSPPSGVSAQAVGGYSNGIYYFKFDESSENSGKPLPVNVAAAISSDPAFEDLAHRDGIDPVIDMAKAFGVGQNAFVQPCSVAGSADGDQAATITDCNDFNGPVNGLASNFSPTRASAHGKANGTPGSPAIALGENPLTPIEQASVFATLADGGLYHTPHVIAVLQQGNATIPLHIAANQVLTPPAAADIDWALSFDNNMNGGTAEANVSFRRGDVIAKTGTLGSGANASQAWFIGATPTQYALSVALFTNNPGTQVLNNLPYANSMPGSQGGGWPATIWNNFMTAQFSNMRFVPLPATQNGLGFVPWIQVNAKKTGPAACKFGQMSGCRCPKHAFWCQNPNPNPTSSCPQQFGQPCNGPSPSPTCGQFGQPCISPSPSPSPSCTQIPAQPPCNTQKTGGAVKTASTISAKLGASTSRSRGSPSRAGVLQPAEEALVLTAPPGRLALLL